MEMYHFSTRWFFQAPIDPVWHEIKDIRSWPQWWHSYKKAVVHGDEKSVWVGSLIDNQVRGALPYSLDYTTQITQWEPPNRLSLKSTGDLVGEGKFILEPRDSGTVVTFYWDVGTSNPVFNLLAKLAPVKWLMEKNHSVVMEDGYQGLRARVEEYSTKN